MLIILLVMCFSSGSYAQNTRATKAAFKIGFVKPNETGKLREIKSNATDFPVTFVSENFKGNVAIGLEFYDALTLKSEMVIAFEWARLEDNIREIVGGVASMETRTYNWLHVPITYKIKFPARNNAEGGAYIGFGLSVLNLSPNQGTDTPILGYHLKTGYQFQKNMGIDVEWSSGKKKKSGVDIGALGVFGLYAF